MTDGIAHLADRLTRDKDGPGGVGSTGPSLTAEDCKGVSMAVSKRTRLERIRQRRASVFPLSGFPDWKQSEIREAIAALKPPPRWIELGHPDDAYPLASIPSRAWYEWHWERGVDPDESKREPIPLSVKQAVLMRDWPYCQLCGGEVAIGEQHLDHIRPYSLGGGETVENLQIAHAACNLAKGARV